MIKVRIQELWNGQIAMIILLASLRVDILMSYYMGISVDKARLIAFEGGTKGNHIANGERSTIELNVVG